jgi:hypothetical protein
LHPEYFGNSTFLIYIGRQMKNTYINISNASFVKEELIKLNFLQENTNLSKEDVINGWQAAKDLNPSMDSYIYLVTGKWTLLEGKAKEQAVKEMKNWSNVAVFVHNGAQKIMGQIIVKIAGLSSKIKFFDNEEKAIKWLDEKIKKGSLKGIEN